MRLGLDSPINNSKEPLMKSPVVILSAGMPRSASTWMYNVVRCLLGSCPDMNGRFSAGWYQDLARLERNPCLLLKLHFYHAQLGAYASLIFYSYRDLRDAMASQQNRFGGPAEMAWADLYVQSHEQWMQRAAYAMKYENMLKDKHGIVANLAAILRARFLMPLGIDSFSPDIEAIVDEVGEMSYDSPGPRNPLYHEVNLFHRRHIINGRTGSWRQLLDPALAVAVADKYRGWFDKYGYDIDGECGASRRVSRLTPA